VNPELQMLQAYENQEQRNNNFIHINLAYQSTIVLIGKDILYVAEVEGTEAFC
jgi:hypothetical protein